MKVWTITEPGVLETTEITDAITPEGYAKVRIVRAGLSVSDADLLRGEKNVTYPVIPGHQGVGIISEIGANDHGFEKGQRVVVSATLPCGKCLNCNADHADRCSSMRMMGISAEGLLRDFAVVPIDNLYQLPQQVKDDEAIFAEHIAMAVRIFQDLGVKKGDYIAIAGATLIGLLLCQVALYYQAIPIVVDNSEFRIAAARTSGAYYLVNAADEDPVRRIREITGGRGCERVAYFTSGNENLSHALEYAAYGGRIAIAGWGYDHTKLNADYHIVLSKQLTLLGINNPENYMTVAINLLANRIANMDVLTSKMISFDEVPATLREMVSDPYRFIKVIVKP